MKKNKLLKIKISEIGALEHVTDRFALHVEYEKHVDDTENFKDAHTLAHAEFILKTYHNGIKVDKKQVHDALVNTTERLRIHTVVHSYDDESENVADCSALDDAYSILN